MDINKVAVIGHGLMGRGIIHTFSASGFKVTAVKRRAEDDRLADYFQRELKKGRMTQAEYNTLWENIEVTTDLNSIADCGLIIENINEDLKMKQELFLELDQICPSNTILTSNTSSIPIGKLGKITNRPDKVVGFHFMSPVRKMKLVEIIKGADTSEETLKAVMHITELIGKTPVMVKDFPGFVLSRLAISLMNEAINILMQGISDSEDIDRIAKLGLNVPVGPLQLADEIGLDVVLDVLDNLYDNFKDTKYAASPLLRNMVDSGYLGRKNGKGFHTYE